VQKRVADEQEEIDEGFACRQLEDGIEDEKNNIDGRPKENKRQHAQRQFAMSEKRHPSLEDEIIQGGIRVVRGKRKETGQGFFGQKVGECLVTPNALRQVAERGLLE